MPCCLILCFNTQPPEGGWVFRLLINMRFFVSTHSRPKAAGLYILDFIYACLVFQHTAARRRLGRPSAPCRFGIVCFNTQPPEGGWISPTAVQTMYDVSTHSRPKAAGPLQQSFIDVNERFNTQPPEGGWRKSREIRKRKQGFNTQPPEGGWIKTRKLQMNQVVSTHSRPKAAGLPAEAPALPPASFNTQPPEGGWYPASAQAASLGCFNTQPPEGGWQTTPFVHSLP